MYATSDSRPWIDRLFPGILIAHWNSSMPYAKSLRVIGQSLEAARVATFELKKDGQDYLVQSDSLSPSAAWILHDLKGENSFTGQNGHRSSPTDPVRFTPLDISRLDSVWQKRRRHRSSFQTQVSSNLSQSLRSLGDHLDRTGVRSFCVSWKPDSVSLDYQEADGKSNYRTFSSQKLHQLGLHSRFRRSSQNWASS